MPSTLAPDRADAALRRQRDGQTRGSHCCCSHVRFAGAGDVFGSGYMSRLLRDIQLPQHLRHLAHSTPHPCKASRLQTLAWSGSDAPRVGQVHQSAWLGPDASALKQSAWPLSRAEDRGITSAGRGVTASASAASAAAWIVASSASDSARPPASLASAPPAPAAELPVPGTRGASCRCLINFYVLAYVPYSHLPS